MSKPDRREILSRVAAGTITPEEAASQLDSLRDDEPEQDTGVRRVRIDKQLGPLEVVGDAGVKDAIAEGPHQARIEGDTMVIEGEGFDHPGSFIFGFGRNVPHGRLLVRVNPSLALDLRVQAGNCRVRGVEGPIRADVQAGSAIIEGFAKPFDFTVQAGSVKATGCCDEGESRIACDAGSVNLHLERGSSVRVKASAHLGKITLPGDVAVGGTRASQDFTIGGGMASLVIDSNMGSVKVTADQ